MNIDLRAGLESGLERVRRLRVPLRRHRFWVECALLSLLSLAAVLSVGSSALSRREAFRTETKRVEEVDAALREWATRVVPASPRESLAWRQSEESLQMLDQQSAEPISVARRVAARAEEVGVRDLRIRLADADSLLVPVALQAGAWSVQPARSGLVVEFTGTVGNIVSFLGALPPQVEVGELTVSATADQLRVRSILAVRRVAEQR